MKLPLWIIAACEVIRAFQNFVQIGMQRRGAEQRDNAYAEFVRSLKMSDREFVRRMLDEFDRQEDEEWD